MSRASRAGGPEKRHIYQKLDVTTLLNILLDNPTKPSVQRDALDQLRTLPPETRRESLIGALSTMVHHRVGYDVGVLTSIIDLLATDPTTEATRAMLDVLPAIAGSTDDPETTLTPEFREYYYQALMTRRRPAEREIWAARLPQLDGETLVNIATDPAAEPLAATIEPMRWIDRLPKRERRKALTSLVAGARARLAIQAIGMLVSGRGSDS